MRWLFCFCLHLGIVISVLLQMPSAVLGQRLPRLQFEDPPIGYSDAEVDNVVSRLQEQIDTGALNLTFGNEHGYLPELLDVLGVPISSQMLTFLKSSLQRPLINPANPRAIYFGDDAYVGYVPGGFIELIVPDAQKGLVFYSLEQDELSPNFKRQVSRCMTCHSSSRTANIPGLQIRSMLPDPQGQPVLAAGSYRTTQASPLNQRWGGWYVAGTHGMMSHRGNFTLPMNKRPKQPIDNAAGQNMRQLPAHIDLSKYPSAQSDIVALMVFEHQIDAHNLMVRVSYAWRIDQASGEPPTWKTEADRLIEHLTFAREFQLKDAIKGEGTFAKTFVSKGRRDTHGRTLREFDLTKRLFRFPCSYTIETKLFMQLPDKVKVYVIQKIVQHIRNLREDFDSAEDKLWSGEDIDATQEMLCEFFPELKLSIESP